MRRSTLAGDVPVSIDGRTSVTRVLNAAIRRAAE
jgi:hypothetical protein